MIRVFRVTRIFCGCRREVLKINDRFASVQEAKIYYKKQCKDLFKYDVKTIYLDYEQEE